MKAIALLATLIVGGCAAGAAPTLDTHEQVDYEPAPRLEQHAWLEQLVGDWIVTATAEMAPGTPPMKMESTENVRSVGGLWVVSEQKASMNGVPFTAIMTLGYDPAKKAFVGTWIDTMQTHMWTYRGTLDAAKKVLTLETEGPSFDDPAKTSQYRDVIELVDADHKVLSSSVKGADGSWTKFLSVEYRRDK